MNPLTGWIAGLLGVILGGVVAVIGFCQTNPMPQNPVETEEPAPQTELEPGLDEFYAGP